MKKLLFILLLFVSCELTYYEPELVEGKCYEFTPPDAFYFDIVDTIMIIGLNEKYISTKSNKGQYVKYKYEGFSPYIREISVFNCNCNGYNIN